MTGESLAVAATALWIGVMTSVSPCPLATNVAAISFVGRRVASPGHVLAGGLLYTAGRAAAYTALGMLLVASLISAPIVSLALQKHMNRVLGPLLILVGMVLLDLIRVGIPGPGGSTTWGRRWAGSGGVWGAGLLGILFALSFCPISAALFFGSLIPLAVKHESPLLLPALYGAGTAVPVLGFAVVTALGAKSLGGAFRRIAAAERWARFATGVIFVVVGIYYCLVHIFRVTAT